MISGPSFSVILLALPQGHKVAAVVTGLRSVLREGHFSGGAFGISEEIPFQQHFGDFSSLGSLQQIKNEGQLGQAPSSRLPS